MFSSADQVDEFKLNFATMALFGVCYYLGYKLFDLYYESKTQNKALKYNLYTNTTFADVHGLTEAKKELQEIIDYLKEPEK